MCWRPAVLAERQLQQRGIRYWGCRDRGLAVQRVPAALYPSSLSTTWGHHRPVRFQSILLLCHRSQLVEAAEVKGTICACPWGAVSASLQQLMHPGRRWLTCLMGSRLPPRDRHRRLVQAVVFLCPQWRLQAVTWAAGRLQRPRTDWQPPAV
jgi:hypothetical protein